MGFDMFDQSTHVLLNIPMIFFPWYPRFAAVSLRDSGDQEKGGGGTQGAAGSGATVQFRCGTWLQGMVEWVIELGSRFIMVSTKSQ